MQKGNLNFLKLSNLNKMKYLSIILFLVLFLHYSCSSVKHDPIEGNKLDFYKIKRITKRDSAYIVLAEKNDSLFKIVVDKKNSTNSNCCNKIKKGQSYPFMLKEYIPWNFPHIIGGVNHGGSHIKREESSHFALYFAKELYFDKKLRKLCFINDSISIEE